MSRFSTKNTPKQRPGKSMAVHTALDLHLHPPKDRE
jgi:hypothetical protein